jgi:hypothetical protein
MATIQTNFVAPIYKRLAKTFRDFYEGKFYDENGKWCEIDVPLKFEPLFEEPENAQT